MGGQKAPATRADASGDSSNGISAIGWRGCTCTAIFQMGRLTIRKETHQAAGSRTCEKRRTAKTPQIQTCVQPLLVVSKGVCWHKKHNKYRARIGFREKVVELGFYNTAREAARAYD
jgi:hypothetical protein